MASTHHAASNAPMVLICIQTFREIIEEGDYVDKSGYAVAAVVKIVVA